MTYEEIFNKVKEQFSQADVSSVNEHLAYQFTAASTLFKKRINKRISIKKVAVLSVKQCAAAFHKAAGVKYETLIDAVIGNTAVDGSGRDDGSITLM